jgi:hypothetical protein
MSDRITQHLPRNDQREARLTIIPKAAPLSEIVPDTFFNGARAGIAGQSAVTLRSFSH